MKQFKDFSFYACRTLKITAKVDGEVYGFVLPGAGGIITNNMKDVVSIMPLFINWKFPPLIYNMFSCIFFVLIVMIDILFNIHSIQ